MRILSFNGAHDSSVCVINDGKLEFFCKEERVSGKKRDNQPFKALDICRSQNLGKIDHVVLGAPTNGEHIAQDIFYTYIRKSFNVDRGCFSELPHHVCHASLAFHNSNFDVALIFVIDRNGTIFYDGNTACAREAESVFVFDKNNKTENQLHKTFWLMSSTESRHEVINKISKYHPECDIQLNSPYSIVKVYEAATTLIGQHPLENGKTMGLSSYGEDLNYEPLFIDDVPLSHKFVSSDAGLNSVVHFADCTNLVEKNLTPENYQFYANKAKQVQLQTQEVALNLISKYVEQTGIKNVCIVGGYGLNVVANQYYIKNLPDVNFYFEPVADDTGVPIGAAMIKYKLETGEYCESLKDNFYHYYDVADRKKKVKDARESSIEEVCDLLINQKCVAIFEGNPEAGPRALGHRSILFDPRNPNAKEIVNRVKNREWYRPFAGTILESEFPKYFDNLDLIQSPHMTINFDAKEHTKQFVPGIIHVDDTCRIQTVNEGFFFELLQLFYKKTGCPMLLNTSFNLAGKPLVQNKLDAAQTFKHSALDAVYFVEDKRLLLK
jgi:carbamoyltransferase